MDPYQAQTIAFAHRRLRANPETYRTFFLADGTPPVPATSTREGDRLVQPDLARTLRALADHGAGALYEGEIGERLVADLQANGGVISRDDLASYAVREYRPGLETEYRGYKLLGLSPTSGSMTAFEALNILRHFDMAGLGAGSPGAVHVVAEALRRAFLDRFAYLADPQMQNVPIEALLSEDYAARLAETIGLDRADPRRPLATRGDSSPLAPVLLVGQAARPGVTVARRT